MKKHLKESLGWGRFNVSHVAGSDASLGRPENCGGDVVEGRPNPGANGIVRPVARSNVVEPAEKDNPRIQLDDRGKILTTSGISDIDKSAVPNGNRSANQKNSEDDLRLPSGTHLVNHEMNGDDDNDNQRMIKKMAISEPVPKDEERRDVITIDDDSISDRGSEKKSDPEREQADDEELDRNGVPDATTEESSDDGENGYQSHRFERQRAEAHKVKRPRGRPPKNWKPSEPKKPRGRPPKERKRSRTRRSAARPRKNGEGRANGIEATGGMFEPLEPQYQPGDLLWSKIGGAPFWPCMVTEDPIENKYYEQKRDFLKYYVQYFGVEVTHGWTQSANRVLPYEGVEAFRDFAKEKIAEVKARQKFFDIDTKRSREAQENWEQALREVAEAAAITPASERYKTFRFAFYPGGGRRKNNGAQSESKSTLPETSQNSPEPSSADVNSGASFDSQSSSSAERWSKSSAQCALDSEASSGSKKRVFNNNVGD